MNRALCSFVFMLLMRLTGQAPGTRMAGLLRSMIEGKLVVGEEDAGRDAGGTMVWQGFRRYDSKN